MPGIIAPNPQQPIIDDQSRQTQAFRTWSQLVTELDLIIATGSPEGVVDAVQGRLYMDNTGATGALLYIKRDPAIGGDSALGWILV